MKSRHVLPLTVIAIVVGAITAACFFLIDWIPLQASEQAERVDPLMWFVVIASGVIFTIVITFLLYSVWRWRATDDDDEDGAPLHGHTKLEIAWTIIPTMLLAAMAVWAYLVLSDNEALAEDRMIVNVTAEQFAWTFTYPDLGVITQLIIDPNRVGKYPVICAELCGLGHNTMRANVFVMPQDAFARWSEDAKRQVAAGPAEQGGQDAGGAAGTVPEGSEQPAGDAAASQ